MILQPFVENAILHGIAALKDGKGVILIRFDREGDAVLCSVQDNGLGMGKSLRNKEQKDHESKSRAITQDRLDIITQLTGKPTALIFENVETGGTKVTIRLPIDLWYRVIFFKEKDVILYQNKNYERFTNRDSDF